MSSLWISSSAAEDVESAQFIIVLPSRYGFETVDSAMRPSLSLMPYCVTILRASSVARSMSFDAPVVAMPKTTCSAARPPNMVWSSTISSSLLDRNFSSSGICMV